ncbi:MAG: cyclic nucleotide-binding domain-containing protein, partial [Thermodesulfobacteriota bacterium]|nr:cyclic nucleotide-binding domain-containing protein [Thermodesulfobacteriota bacterium]
TGTRSAMTSQTTILSRKKISDDELSRLFPFVGPEKRRDFLSFLDYREIPAGFTLFRQGDPADFMAFIVAGKFAVKKETAFPGKFILLAILNSGAIVGEISLVDGRQRTVTVESMETGRLLILKSRKFQDLLTDNPVLGIHLLKHSIHVIGTRLQKSGERLALLL